VQNLYRRTITIVWTNCLAKGILFPAKIHTLRSYRVYISPSRWAKNDNCCFTSRFLASATIWDQASHGRDPTDGFTFMFILPVQWAWCVKGNKPIRLAVYENLAIHLSILLTFWTSVGVKAKLHWGVARSSRARFFVCFVASGNSALVHGSARELLGAIKQTEIVRGYSWQLLSVDWPLASRGFGNIYLLFLVVRRQQSKLAQSSSSECRKRNIESREWFFNFFGWSSSTFLGHLRSFSRLLSRTWAVILPNALRTPVKAAQETGVVYSITQDLSKASCTTLRTSSTEYGKFFARA